MVPIATTQLCCCSTKAAIDNTETSKCGCLSINISLQKQAVGQIWSMSHSLSTPMLVDAIGVKQVKCDMNTYRVSHEKIPRDEQEDYLSIGKG